MDYLAVIEKGPNSYGAYVPDLPGCVAAGETREDVLQLIQEAITFHLEDLKEGGRPVPPQHQVWKPFTSMHSSVTPNCGGELVPRPTRSPAKLANNLASPQRVYKRAGCVKTA